MTRFARKGGVIEKKETKKKKEEATDWTSMISSLSANQAEIKNDEEKNKNNDEKFETKVEDESVKKRKNEEILDRKMREQDRELVDNEEKRKKPPVKLDILLRIHGEFIDKEVLNDLDDMLARKRITEEDYADAIVREGRSNRRRLDRKAERDSSRVCFNCRKPGHCVDECPEVVKDHEQGTGICYKCGSTEHSVNKCKVRVEPGKFPYATCFICKEQGHLSKQCPDNPRGLYPNGNF